MTERRQVHVPPRPLPAPAPPAMQASTCSGDCQQGRRCPTRQACNLPLDDDAYAWLDDFKRAVPWIALLIVLAFTLCLAAGYFVGRAF
jgi:hypothetical protein